MLTHEELKARALSDPTVRAEHERIEREEMPMCRALHLKPARLAISTFFGQKSLQPSTLLGQD
jgi:ABC-type Fe3+/spermidine/putrescine transport system ATPase subunit